MAMAPTADTVEIKPLLGMQEEFLSRSEFEVMFGGQAGAGSSWAMLYEPLLFNWTDIPNFVAIYFRRESPQLGDLITQAMDLYRPCGARFVGQDPIYHRAAFLWPSGAKILFSHMQTLADMQNIHGHQYHRVYVNELTRFPEVMYLYMMSRIRGKEQDFPYGIRSDANPEEDNEGYLWVYDRFVEKLGHQFLKPRWFVRQSDRDQEVPRGTSYSISRVMVPKFRRENTHLNAGYEANLRQLTEKQQKALLLGLWTLPSLPNQVIPTEAWQRAISGDIKQKGRSKDFGADFAHWGKDKSVLLYGIGNQPQWCKSWPQTKTTEFGRIIADSMRHEGLTDTWTAVDGNGPGAGVGDYLSEDKDVSGRFERCIQKDHEFAAMVKQRYGGRIQFDNWRSMAWWKLREDMIRGDIDLSVLHKGSGYFIDWNLLQQDILAHVFTEPEGKIKVISKEDLRKADKLGRSPDHGDALVMWNWGRGKGLRVASRLNDSNADYGLRGNVQEKESEKDVGI
jgi:hypothetical protein